MKKIGLLAMFLAMSSALPSNADTLETALAKAYENNPALKSVRASTMAVDENVALAKSGYRPTLSIDGGYSETNISTNDRINGNATKDVDGCSKLYGIKPKL